MTKTQYEKCVQYVLLDGTGKDNDMVDYEALCRYSVRAAMLIMRCCKEIVRRL